MQLTGGGGKRASNRMAKDYANVINLRRRTKNTTGPDQMEAAIAGPSRTESATAHHVVRQLMTDVLGGGNLDHLSELVAPNYVGHFSSGDYYGPEGLRIDVATFRTAFPDLTVRLDELFECGDRVIRRFTIQGTQTELFLGHPPTGGNATVTGIGIDRVAGGQLQESWVFIEYAPRAPPTRS